MNLTHEVRRIGLTGICGLGVGILGNGCANMGREVVKVADPFDVRSGLQEVFGITPATPQVNWPIIPKEESSPVKTYDNVEFDFYYPPINDYVKYLGNFRVHTNEFRFQGNGGSWAVMKYDNVRCVTTKFGTPQVIIGYKNFFSTGFIFPNKDKGEMAKELVAQARGFGYKIKDNW